MQDDFKRLDGLIVLDGCEAVKENWHLIMDKMKAYYISLVHAYRMFLCTNKPYG